MVRNQTLFWIQGTCGIILVAAYIFASQWGGSVNSEYATGFWAAIGLTLGLDIVGTLLKNNLRVKNILFVIATICGVITLPYGFSYIGV